MRVWLLQGEGGEDLEGLEALLHQCSRQQSFLSLQVECHQVTAALASCVRRQRPDLLVTAHRRCPSPALLAEILPLGVSLLVAVSREQAEAYASLAGRYSIHLFALPVAVEAFGLVLATAVLGHYRQQAWSGQVAQLQQRLQDRIIIERAKGVLLQRLGISEEEAYKRLRTLSRQQRRPIRDIAQSVLDTQQLLLPPSGNGLPPLAPRAMPPADGAAPLDPEQPAEAARRWPEKAQTIPQ